MASSSKRVEHSGFTTQLSSCHLNQELRSYSYGKIYVYVYIYTLVHTKDISSSCARHHPSTCPDTQWMKYHLLCNSLLRLSNTMILTTHAVNEYILGKKSPFSMMTSSNGNIFRVTGPLCGEFTGPRWIPRTKAGDAELWCFLWSTPD